MTQVYRCDRCGQISPHDGTVRVSVLGVVKVWDFAVDLCIACTQEIFAPLGLKTGDEK